MPVKTPTLELNPDHINDTVLLNDVEGPLVALCADVALQAQDSSSYWVEFDADHTNLHVEPVHGSFTAMPKVSLGLVSDYTQLPDQDREQGPLTETELEIDDHVLDGAITDDRLALMLTPELIVAGINNASTNKNIPLCVQFARALRADTTSGGITGADGIARYPHTLEMLDADMVDIIIQHAIFDDVIYG